MVNEGRTGDDDDRRALTSTRDRVGRQAPLGICARLRLRLLPNNHALTMRASHGVEPDQLGLHEQRRRWFFARCRRSRGPAAPALLL